MGEAARLRPFETPKAPLFTSRYLTPETKGQGRRDLPRETTQAESALLQGRFVTPLERREEPPLPHPARPFPGSLQPLVFLGFHPNLSDNRRSGAIGLRGKLLSLSPFIILQMGQRRNRT